MATFTITQFSENESLYLIPDANGCNINLTPVGKANNWECVDDPVKMPNSNIDYVYNSEVSLKYDLYILPNHTIETGLINYVQIFSRTTSQPYPQHQDGIHKIILTENACTNIYKSDDIDLTTSYATYYHYWNVNPRTSAAWTWDDIDKLQVGIESSSPSTTKIKEFTIRPVDNGVIECFRTPGTNWTCVNDYIKDNFASCVWTHNGTSTDFYILADHTTETGDITKVAIYAYVLGKNVTCWAKTTIKTQGTNYYGIQENTNPIDTWTLINTNYTTNPNTGVAWTWDDIDALQGGIQLCGTTGNRTYCTQAYIVVTYMHVTPQIRTTQVYAKVNHHATVECTLNKPEEISVEETRNIKMLNFWSGNREVYDLSRNKKSIVLKGSEYQSVTCDAACPCERITCIRNMGKRKGAITITGLRSLFNGKYKIRSFGWEHISTKPECYEWILELESSTPNEELIIRPSGQGAATELSGIGHNWTLVNETVKDDFASYVWINSAEGTDFYILHNHTVEKGIIEKVSIFAYVWGSDISSWAKTAIRTQGAEYYGTQENTNPINTWILINTDYTINPNTGIAWTWDDIDALQGGVQLDASAGGSNQVYCTQVYVVIKYAKKK